MKRKIFYSIASVLVVAFILFACRKEIIDVAVENVKLDLSEATLDFNGTLALTATIEPEDAFNQYLRWTSTNPSIATVNEDGVVTAKNTSGTTTIIVTTEDGGFTATCLVTVMRQVTGVLINPKPISLVAGNMQTLTATITPVDASNKTVLWSSSNPAVATVNSNGVVTAVSAGTTIIRAATQDGTKYDDCVVTVTPASVPVVAVTLDRTTATLTTVNPDNILTLTATVLPADATNKTVTWSSSHPSIASVHSSSGVVTAVSAGTATITATTEDGNRSATCIITVSTPVQVIGINQSSLTFTAGDPAVTLTPLFTPNNASDKTIEWKITPSSGVATIKHNTDNTCTVTPATTVAATATATIIVATANGLTAFCNVTVNPLSIPVESVSLPSTLTINGSETTKTLTASILPVSAINKNVTWTSSDPTVATVSGSGLTVNIIPVAPTGGITTPRTTTITVTTADGSHTATCAVTVSYVAVTGVTVNKTTLPLTAGNTETLTATIAPANASIKTVTWSSSASGVATVVPTTGLVVAVSAGPATITATSVADPTKTVNCAVTVTAP